MLKVYIVVLLSLLVCLVYSRNQEGKLEIITEYEPEECRLKAKAGDKVQIHYTGRLESNIVFDSSRVEGRQPIEFTLGIRQVIPGWDAGIEGMCVGERRKLVIPPEMAYGQSGHPPVIPENAWLYFDAEMIGISPGPSAGVSVGVIFAAVQFWAVPLLFLGVAYKLYQRYQESQATNKPSKAEKYANRKNKRH